MSQAAFPSESTARAAAGEHHHHQQSSGGGGGGGGLLPFYHVPQHSRREKLRYPPCTADVVDPLFMAIAPTSSSNPTTFLHHHHNNSTTSNHPNPNPNPAAAFNNYVSSTTPTQFDLSADTNLHGHYGSTFFLPHHRHAASLSLLPAPPQPPPPPPLPVVCRGPAEPFTGYAAVLKGSRFLRPAQQLLEEICDAGLSRAAPLLACSDDGLGEPEGITGDLCVGAGGGGDGGERRRTKTRLISMFDEVCRRYKQYCQQIQDVITSFESVAGLSNAAPYTSLALNSMTKHFRSLKSAISDQLHFTDRALGKEGHSKDELSGFGLLNSGLCYPGASARTSGTMMQPNVWRPQRGLPERAVAVLKAWLFEHFLHPYPTDADKHMLARQTGLSRNQVSNWFINARVRLWKPLVEEIHALEMRQARKATDQSDSNRGSTGQSTNLPSTSTNHQSTEQPSQEVVGLGKNPASRQHRNDQLVEVANYMDEPPVRFSFNDFSGGRVGGATASIPSSGNNNGGVSLTLGLHQNNGVCLPEALPFSVARRFGLEEDTGTPPYSVGGLQVQDRQFGKDIDGQLLRDFGG